MAGLGWGRVLRATLGSKEGVTRLTASIDEELLLRAFVFLPVMDATVVTRHFEVLLEDASGAVIYNFYRGDLTASASKTLQVGLEHPASYGMDADIALGEGFSIPAGYSLYFLWSSLQAGDTWVARVLYQGRGGTFGPSLTNIGKGASVGATPGGEVGIL